jgi:hypothetical protein
MARKVDLRLKILTEDEVKILSLGLQKLFGPKSVPNESSWDRSRDNRSIYAVASRCQHAREAKGLSSKRLPPS